MPFESEDFDPYSSNIYLHDNIIEGNAGPTDATTEFGQLFTGILGGEPVDLITDGIFKPESYNEEGQPQGYCFSNNGENLKFVNLNAGMGPAPQDMARNMNTDLAPFNCELPTFDTSEHASWLDAD